MTFWERLRHCGVSPHWAGPGPKSSLLNMLFPKPKPEEFDRWGSFLVQTKLRSQHHFCSTADTQGLVCSLRQQRGKNWLSAAEDGADWEKLTGSLLGKLTSKFGEVSIQMPVDGGILVLDWATWFLGLGCRSQIHGTIVFDLLRLKFNCLWDLKSRRYSSLPADQAHAHPPPIHGPPANGRWLHETASHGNCRTRVKLHRQSWSSCESGFRPSWSPRVTQGLSELSLW